MVRSKGDMSPLAKGIRTFAAAMVGVLGAVVVASQAGDYHAGLVTLTIGAVAAVLAGAVSFAQAAATGLAATTPLTMALATFLQFTAAGLATVVVADLTDVASLPKTLLPLLVAAVVAAAQTFAQNTAEASPA